MLLDIRHRQWVHVACARSMCMHTGGGACVYDVSMCVACAR